MKQLLFTVVLLHYLSISFIAWGSQECTISGDPSVVFHEFKHHTSPKAFSCQGAELFAQKNKVNTRHLETAHSANIHQSNIYSSQISVGKYSVSVSIDSISCIHLASNSLNIMSALLKYFIKGCGRVFEGNSTHKNRETGCLAEEILYTIDQHRFAIYQNASSYHQALKDDIRYLEDIQQEIQVTCHTRTAQNKHYYSAYRKIEACIDDELHILKIQCNVISLEKKKNAVRLARKALDLVIAHKHKDKKAKKRFIAEYTQAITDAETAYIHYVHEEEAIKALRIHEQKKQDLFYVQHGALAEYCNEQKEIAVLVEPFNAAYGARLEKRLNALALIEKDGLCVTTEQYTVSDHTLLYFKAEGFDSNAITFNIGNQYQQCIHQEMLTVVDATISLPYYSPLRLQKEALIACSASAILYNKEGYIHIATLIADLCWSLLDYGNAVVEGATIGIIGAVQTVFNHPFEAAVSVAVGHYIFAYQMAKLLYTVADVCITASYDSEYASEKWDEFTKPITNFYNTLTDKELSTHDTVKVATAVATGFYAHTKLIGGLRKFCKGILESVNVFRRVYANGSPQEYLNTPEGSLYKSSVDVLNSRKNYFDKNNLLDAINQTEIAILKNGYYEVNGFKFSEYYYGRLWNNGRGAPSLLAKEILENAICCEIDIKKAGFFRYVTNNWEMVYNPITKEVWHLSPIKKLK